MSTLIEQMASDTEFLFIVFIAPWMVFIMSWLFSLAVILGLIRAFVTRQKQPVVIVGRYEE